MVLIFISFMMWTNVASSQGSGHAPNGATAPADVTATATIAAPARAETAPATASAPTEAAETVKSFEQIFQSGLQHYQNKSFDNAQVAFKDALQMKPDNISILTNLGLVSFELGKSGLSLAYLRRALGIDADFRPAQIAYDYVWSKLEVKELPHRIETYETLRQYFLMPVSLGTYLWLGGLCFLFSGWLLIRYLGQRRRALLEEQALPPFPTVASLIFTLFIAIFSLTLLKAYDLSLIRGTIISQKVSLYTAPSESETSLFEITQGLEVIIRKTNGDWIQVTYPGGPTGWMKLSDLMITTSKGL